MKLNLTAQTSIAISLIVTALLCAFGSYGYLAQSRTWRGQLQQKADMAMTRLVKSAENALWAMDPSQLENMMAAEMQDADIGSIMVKEGTDPHLKLYKAVERGEAGKVVAITAEPRATGITLSKPILHEATQLGVATLNLSGAGFRAQSRSLLLSKVVEILALNLAVIFGVVLVVRYRLALPLNRIVSGLQRAAATLETSVAVGSQNSQSLAEGSSEQAASLEETSASLEEIAGMTKRNAENALSAKDLSSETRSAAETGSANMQEMSRAMGDIQSASSNISKIIKTIDEIAFQTNILALNAAVEAARAGQAGAGFAVVADEVRNLAQRSAQAAKETAEKIEDSIAKSANGVAISGKVTESLDQIVTKARQVDELVAEIATVSREQSQGLDQVNTAVTQMGKVTQTNAATAEESASASEELSTQAATLREIVAELQKLVTGSGSVAAQNSGTRREILHTRSYSPPARRQAPARSADHPVLNGNGSRPALGSSKMRDPETEIPLEEGFKDF